MRKCSVFDMETAALAGDIAHKLPGLAMLNYGVPGSEAELLGCRELAQAVITCCYVCGFTNALFSVVCSFVSFLEREQMWSCVGRWKESRRALGKTNHVQNTLYGNCF